MRLNVRTAAVIVVLASLAASANSFGGTWIFDDLPSVVNNATIRDWRAAFFPPSGGLTVSGRPVLNLSFAASYALSGTATWGHHLVNWLIHTLAGLTLFGLVRRTLLLPSLAPRWGAHALPFAFFISLLWTLHPLQTQAVTYLVQRAESLMGLCFLLTFYAYLRSVTPSKVDGDHRAPSQRDRPRDTAQKSPSLASAPFAWSAASVAACLLGVATKEVTVVAPVLVLLHDRAFVAGSFLAAWRARRPLYLGLFATWLPLAALVAGTGGNRSGTSGFDVGVGAVAYWLTQFEALTRYLALAFWPHPLVFEYGTFWTSGFAAVAPFALVVTPLAVATLWALWRHPKIGFLGGWFFAILAPTSITPGTIQMIVEHRMYLPLAAILTLAVFAAHTYLGRRARWLGATAALVFAALTEHRNRDYRSDLALWSDTLAKRPNNAAAHNGVAVALIATGQNLPALSHLARAMELDPQRSEYRNNYAGLDNGHAVELLGAGQVNSSLDHFAQATRFAPQRADYLANYAGALARAGRTADAIARYEDALRLNPTYAEAHANLSLILSEADRPADAITHGETALRLAPRYAPAHLNLGIALLRAGRAADSATALETALRLNPSSPEAHNTLGVALINLGRATEATPHFETALRLRPDYPQARGNLARLRALLAR